MFARTKAAFEGIENFDATRLGFFVLTLDRDGWFSGNPWPDEHTAYAWLSTMARKFLKRLNRMAIKYGVEPIGNRWTATVESHKSGWPHYQLMLYLPKEWIAELPPEEGFLPGYSDIADDVRAHAMACGWGKVSSFERCRDWLATLGYLIGTAGKHDDSVARLRGELHKLSQLPMNAPARFRRVRSGKGFLPPRFKDLSKTGTLIRRQWCDDGTPLAMPLHDIKDEVTKEIAARCCYFEERVWMAEVRGRSLGLPMLAAAPELREELFPRFASFGIVPNRGPPIAEPVRLTGELSGDLRSQVENFFRTQMALPYVASS